ncbi:protein-L-isoaspartate O-methyltransferase [Candidatus Pacearchaeota archaeon]|nr:protein-L-isoaspartate O-methyltransferase [Candidatus Pacearchaeota archaeon]
MDKTSLLNILKSQNLPEKIVNVFEVVPRENFVPERLAAYAYEDLALPLEDGSSISQPSTIAFMLSLLDPKQNQKILEIGSGSGYALALISQIIKNGKIFGLEINKVLAIKSKRILDRDSNVQILNRSGINGLPEFAPFDRILVSAAFNDLRIPFAISDQLADNGIMIAPVKSSIFKLEKIDGKLKETQYPGFAFVPFKEE